jgi:hypothetical protein
MSRHAAAGGRQERRMMTSPACLPSALAILATLAIATTPGRTADMPDETGPTLIPFYTGNLSVSYFMQYWGTGPAQVNDFETPERIALLKRTSCIADCDYLGWCRCEPEPGRWDFAPYRRNCDALHAAGLKYVPFCWLHFPPRWYQEEAGFVPYRCLEHGEEVKQQSLWAPATPEIYDHFYAKLADAFGRDIDFLRLAMPSDYGEIGYPAAMTSWLVPQEHAHAGYWCGDRYARRAFREFVERKFKTVAAANAAWGTEWKSFDDVTFPEVNDDLAAARRARESGKPADRRRWLDFVAWYHQSQLDFMRQAVGIVRRYLPDIEIVVSVGYASELPAYGNDYGAIPKLAAELGVSLQTPGNVGYLPLKRVATACHFYGARYYTEPPGRVDRNAQVARIFNDADDGAQMWFDYPGNLDGARDLFHDYAGYLTGKPAITDVALFMPMSDHRLHPGNGFPPELMETADRLRERMDYGVVDELMAANGALKKYRLLIMPAGHVFEARALAAIEKWVRGGGVLFCREVGGVETIDGDRGFEKRLMPRDLPPVDDIAPAGALDYDAAVERCARRVGRGYVVKLPAGWEHSALFFELATRLNFDLRRLDPKLRNGVVIETGDNGVATALFADRILLHNSGDGEVALHVALRPADFEHRDDLGRPAKWAYDLTLAPHSIAAIALRRPTPAQ